MPHGHPGDTEEMQVPIQEMEGLPTCLGPRWQYYWRLVNYKVTTISTPPWCAILPVPWPIFHDLTLALPCGSQRIVGRLSLHPSPYCQHGRESRKEPTPSPMEVGAETSYEELWPSAAPHPTDLSTGQQTEIPRKALTCQMGSQQNIQESAWGWVGEGGLTSCNSEMAHLPFTKLKLGEAG